ncbi:unnamed protein product [Blepharisma stoltei]|uniref:Phosphorylated adapter RNA export protein n=1 Tax=Blepharisma stoltei TaxID=1481888 RepID=A0AAU9IFR6_9CILI|nr:unnamed protein product [Blepharisma stoltei]
MSDINLCNIENLRPEDPNLAVAIACLLGEPAVNLISRITTILGGEFVISTTKKVIALQTEGGVPTLNGSRNRTSGGIFFSFVKKTIARDIVKLIFNEKPRQAIEPLEANFSKLTV